jgi:uncharacterized protein (DUF1800 family)
VAAFHRRGLSGAVDWLVSKTEPEFALDWGTDELIEKREAIRMARKENDQMQVQELGKELRKVNQQRIRALQETWISRMIHTEHPLAEKLTLFWHGHFATSFEKVDDAWLMWRQNELLRAGALGPFGDLAKGISRDGAMIRWLDLDRSTKRAPNENFARELMELFTLGEGNYTEADIKEAARAFSGYRFSPRDRAFQIATGQHDDGSKQVFGKSGNYSGDDIIDFILENRACSRFIGSRLWEFFAGPEPDAALATALGEALRQQNYAIRPFLARIFQSRLFYSKGVAHALIKGPVDWLVNACRTLEIEAPPIPVLTEWFRQLGQVPFAPPNVRGWEGGRSWISATTLIARGTYAGILVGAKNPQHPSMRDGRFTPANPLPWVQGIPPEDIAAIAQVLAVRLFGPRPADSAVLAAQAALRESGTDLIGLRTALHRLMCLPEYQLA